jgi:hypothetical protein
MRIPQAITASMNYWIYGTPTADTGNAGFERRAASFDTTSGGRIILYAPGFPVAINGVGVYEIHPRIQRERKGKAINAAVGQLGLIYWRDFMDNSIVTAQPTDGGVAGQAGGWLYNLTALMSPTVPIARVSSVQIEVGTSSLLESGGYPYVAATPWNYNVYSTKDASGVETWWLQFEIMPPPGRKLKIFGEAYATQLVADTDILPVGGQWEQPTLEWIYDWAQYLLNQQIASRVSAADTQRWRQAEFDRLQTAKEKLLLESPTHANSIIAVPGKGDGLYTYSAGNQAGWLGSFRSTH